MTFGMMAKTYNAIRHNSTQGNDTPHNKMTLNKAALSTKHNDPHNTTLSIMTPIIISQKNDTQQNIPY